MRVPQGSETRRTSAVSGLASTCDRVTWVPSACEVFAGSATVAPIPATGKTLTAVFSWFPELSPGMLANANWQKATGGDLRLTGDDRILHTIPTLVGKNSKRGVWSLKVDKKP